MKKLLALLLATAFTFACFGCSSDYDDTYDPYDSYFEDYYNNCYDDYEDEYDDSYSEEIPETTSAPETTAAPETTKAPETTSEPSPAKPMSPPQFTDLDSLAKYINEQINSGNHEVSFLWKAKVDNTFARMLAQMSSSSYVTYTSKGYIYTATFYNYPGDRIVAAHRSGDLSVLTYDERAAYDVAIGMVNEARSKAADNFELELLIHDMICEKVEYYDDARDFSDPLSPPRYLTVIGALLDGKANCQGYTDAFYTLASIAGFTVDRMNVETPNDLHTLNTILLDGAWYVVDTTFDDLGDDRPINHRLFNAGLDVIREFEWKSYKEKHPISPVSGDYFYYNHYKIVYNTLADAAASMANEWASTNKSIFHAMIKGNWNWDDFKGELSAALNQTDLAYKYRYYYRKTIDAGYYTVLFE